MLVLIFDTHAHYDDHAFDQDRLEFLSSLTQHNILGLVNVGVNLETSTTSVKYSKRYEFVFASVGIHPSCAKNLPFDYIEQLAALTKQGKVIALGEIGLDYHQEADVRLVQQKVFEEQLALACRLNLPVIVHSREACEDTLAILKNQTPDSFVMHCFSYGPQIADQLLTMGALLGFTGVATFKNAKKTREVLEITPQDRILIETDCPYLAPEPYRGTRCDSSMLHLTAQQIAQIKQKELGEMICILNANASRFFKNELAVQ